MVVAVTGIQTPNAFHHPYIDLNSEVSEVDADQHDPIHGHQILHQSIPFKVCQSIDGVHQLLFAIVFCMTWQSLQLQRTQTHDQSGQLRQATQGK